MSTSYVNPFALSTSLTPERIDQGVDYAGSGPIAAIGEAEIDYAGPSNGWPGEYVAYQLLNGPDKGDEVYVAEGITPLVRRGQRVKAGQAIADFVRGSSTGIETGFAQHAGPYEPLAQATGGYKEGDLTAAGSAFSSLLTSLGAPAGKTEGRSTTGSPSLLTQALGAAAGAGGTLAGETIGAIEKAKLNPLEGADKAIAELPQDIVEYGVKTVEPLALKALLYSAFVLGAVALVIYGFATMVKPSPPKLPGAVPIPV